MRWLNNAITNGSYTLTFTTGSYAKWTCPTGVHLVSVSCWGLGADGRTHHNVGGGGGAFASSIVQVTPGIEYTYGVGDTGWSFASYFGIYGTSWTGLYAWAVGGHTISGTGSEVPGPGLASECVGDIRFSGGTAYGGFGGGGAGSGGAGGNARGGNVSPFYGIGTALGGGNGGLEHGGDGGVAGGGGGGEWGMGGAGLMTIQCWLQ